MGYLDSNPKVKCDRKRTNFVKENTSLNHSICKSVSNVPEKLAVCKFCKETFSDREVMRKHRREKHKESLEAEKKNSNDTKIPMLPKLQVNSGSPKRSQSTGNLDKADFQSP